MRCAHTQASTTVHAHTHAPHTCTHTHTHHTQCTQACSHTHTHSHTTLKHTHTCTNIGGCTEMALAKDKPHFGTPHRIGTRTVLEIGTPLQQKSLRQNHHQLHGHNSCDDYIKFHVCLQNVRTLACLGCRPAYTPTIRRRCSGSHWLPSYGQRGPP